MQSIGADIFLNKIYKCPKSTWKCSTLLILGKWKLKLQHPLVWNPSKRNKITLGANGEIGNCIVDGNIKWCNCVEKSRLLPQEIRSRISNFLFSYIPKIIEGRNSYRYLHSHVHSMITHNDQKMKAILMFIKDEWVNLHMMEYNLVFKKNENSDTCQDMDEFLDYYTEVNKYKDLIIILVWGN